MPSGAGRGCPNATLRKLRLATESLPTLAAPQRSLTLATRPARFQEPVNSLQFSTKRFLRIREQLAIQCLSGGLKPSDVPSRRALVARVARIDIEVGSQNWWRNLSESSDL